MGALVATRPQSDGSLAGTEFDGTNYADAGVTPAAGGAIDWSRVHGAFYQNGFVYYVYSDSHFYKVAFDGTTFATPEDLTTGAGYVVPLSNFDATITALAYDNGRIYYTRSGDARIFWRWFSLESGIVGSQAMLAYGSSAAGINGLDFAGATLYATTTSGGLFTIPFTSNGSTYWSHRVLVDDGTVSGVHWGNEGDVFLTPPGSAPAPAD